MTDADLWNVAARLLMGDYVHPKIVTKLVCYVARYTDPTPLAECLERIAAERGGKYITDVPFGKPYATFGTVFVWLDRLGGDESEAQLVIEERDAAYSVAVKTAGELHRLLDTMGVKP